MTDPVYCPEKTEETETTHRHGRVRHVVELDEHQKPKDACVVPDKVYIFKTPLHVVERSEA